jgi:hypothetical protein
MKKATSVVLRNATGVTGGKAMAVGLQPSQLLAAYLQMERQAGLTLFKLTADAQERLEDLLVRRKDVGLTSEEQADLDALAELDRIFTYINAQLALAQGQTAGP